MRGAETEKDLTICRYAAEKNAAKYRKNYSTLYYQKCKQKMPINVKYVTEFIYTDYEN